MTDPRSQAERDLTTTLVRLARTYRRLIDRTLAAHGLSDARALPVLHIARLGEGVRQGVLAEELGMEGPSLVRLLDQVCAAGLVERHDDPRDRRAKTLHLTPEGRAMAGVVETALKAMRTSLLAEVSAADLAIARDVLFRLDAAVERAEHAAAGTGA